MSCKHFAFYSECVMFNNIEHCQKINYARLSNEKPFDHITRFFPMIYIYTNLEQLYLYLPDEDQLNILPAIVPNLKKLHIILKTARYVDLNWLSKLNKLETCSIERKYSIVDFHKKIFIVYCSANLWNCNRS